MINIDKIMKCENKYIECFSKATEQQDFIRYRDDLIPDMYYHNYTMVRSIKDDSALIRLIESEIAYSKNTGKDFCLIRCHIPVNDSIPALLSHKPEEVSKAGHYVFDISALPKLDNGMEYSILKVDKPEMLEDLLWLDLQQDEESLGRDFCTRRVYRRKDIYLSDEGMNAYICYENGEIIGTCNMFIYEDTAKIEDFCVTSQKQRKGYGTAILKTLIKIALEKNVTVIYLETDENDTAKEMYKKRGFYKVGELTDLLFKI